MSAAAVPRCIALVGPTASGKSAAALAICERYDAEIVSVDSALVYRGMDIGTAKPTAAERAAVSHHLIDIRDPPQAYSAAEFTADAQRLIGEINTRGRLALLVGGTMLYVKALLSGGLDPMPSADAALRASIEREAAEHGWPALHARLAQVDPITAARVAPRDSQRIQRALEVFSLSGRPLSAFFHDAVATSTTIERRRFVSGIATVVSLEPMCRRWLHERIALRFDEMLGNGLLDEVRRLRARGDLNAQSPSMRCVGYRQAWAVLDGTIPLSELRDRGIFATRQLAKRQLTWLRSMHERRVVQCDARDALAQLLVAVEQAMQAEGVR